MVEWGAPAVTRAPASTPRYHAEVPPEWSATVPSAGNRSLGSGGTTMALEEIVSFVLILT